MATTSRAADSSGRNPDSHVNFGLERGLGEARGGQKPKERGESRNYSNLVLQGSSWAAVAVSSLQRPSRVRAVVKPGPIWTPPGPSPRLLSKRGDTATTD